MTNLVRLTNFKPEPAVLALLQTLEKSGFDSPFIRGGALRDDYLGIPDKINDYDIIAGFGSVIPDFATRDAGIWKRIASSVQEIFPDAEIKKRDVMGLDGDEITGFIGTGIDFKIPTLPEISLYLSNRNREQFEKSILQADAPINAIAMNSKGEVLAHEDFEEHAAKHLYKPNKDLDYLVREDLEARFNKLARKIPDLKSEGLEKLPSRDMQSTCETNIRAHKGPEV